jgi:hypothetical protein
MRRYGVYTRRVRRLFEHYETSNNWLIFSLSCFLLSAAARNNQLEQARRKPHYSR